MSLDILAGKLKGEVHSDLLSRTIYATDASIYKEFPMGVVYPADEADLVTLVQVCQEQGWSLIPRTAGTSLAGQCVGRGVVVDFSRHMTSILELNVEEHWVRVQPGVIRDELNRYLKPYGLMFGPNTATANRCMLGGMVGNNSCGSTSIVYGSTRDHVIAARTVLHEGSVAWFGACTPQELNQWMQQPTTVGRLYQDLVSLLDDQKLSEQVRINYPKSSIRRRNNGYALDALMDMYPFRREGEPFNLAKLLAGSEGTLGLFAELKLNLVPCPPPGAAMLAVHFTTIDAALQAVPSIMAFAPYACELMDKLILDCTYAHPQFVQDRAFVIGDPAAVLMIECRADDDQRAIAACAKMKAALEQAHHGYAWPILQGAGVARAWALRQAGLGLLALLPGEKKAVACIEDTAVDINELPAYIHEVEELMAKAEQRSVYYAHAGDGELHLRPVLDLRDAHDIKLLRELSHRSAQLVKKYGGSLAGEHGVGRVRGEFLEEFIGPENYAILRQIKAIWDPQNIFNPGKIVDAPPMDQDLRPNPATRLDTIIHFEETWGFLGAAERCNGSGDCRKLPSAGGGMCPSYQATRQEKDSTRARANALREYVSAPQNVQNPWDHAGLHEVLDLCLSCKACKIECPAGVDISLLKAEWQYHYYQTHRRPWAHYVFSRNGSLFNWAGRWPRLANWFSGSTLGQLTKSILGMAKQRPWPTWSQQSWREWTKHNGNPPKSDKPIKVILLADEFINSFEGHIGITATKLLQSLGYSVQIWPTNSGRALITKGFLKEARTLADKNIRQAHSLTLADTVLVGIEPSAILGFRDEYPRLCSPSLRDEAEAIKNRTWLFEEFFAQEIRAGRITKDQFTKEPAHLVYHGHCHQKALTEVKDAITCLSLPEQYHVELIPAGCCGLAGSFGYEEEHYGLSMAIGEMVLFPTVRQAGPHKQIVATGMSCRAQIHHGTGRTALHPVEVLHSALNS